MIIHQEPQVYFPNAANLAKDDPLYLLTQHPDSKRKGDSNAINLKTAGGMDFMVLAKNREWNKDFWNDFVGPTLKDDMDDETWIRGPIPPIADSDGIHKTFDIKYINLGFMGVRWAWPETNDHAKWGITLHKPWVCVGDINRMISQRKRGGGTIAFQNQILWQGLSKSALLLCRQDTAERTLSSCSRHRIILTRSRLLKPRSPLPTRKSAIVATGKVFDAVRPRRVRDVSWRIPQGESCEDDGILLQAGGFSQGTAVPAAIISLRIQPIRGDSI